MAPEKIGRYEIKSELGRGGMATVYRGWDPLFEREVAVKVLPPELLHSDPQFKMRFEREAKIIASLEHPSIVPVYDVGDDSGQPYFVMRYMSGGSLSDRIKAKNLTVEDSIKILGQLAPGLDEAHTKGIVHRDLKPSNILFDGKGTPYISDFGIAKLSQAQSGNMTGSAIIGTPAYMAPEQAQGTGVDGRTDIYAVGIILFEMLTGKQPYEADTPMAVAFKHITDPVPNIHDTNPALPQAVDTVIQKAMAKNKDERFSTATDMVDTLRTISSGQKVSVEMPTIKGALPKVQAQIPAAKTAMATPKAAEVPVAKPFNIWLIIVPVVLIAMLGGGGYFVFSLINGPEATSAPTLTQTVAVPTETSEPTLQATETSASIPVIVDTPTETLIPATDTPSAPVIPVIGGADKIAFFGNKEIYMMDLDGQNLQQLTFDGAVKSDLQWLSDGETIVFLSGKTIKYYNIATDTVDTLATFPSEASVDAFQVSHDGKLVMLAMSNEIFVVPFSLEAMKGLTNRGQVLRMEGSCILPTPKTPAALRVQEARWSVDDKLVAWLFKGNDPNNPAVQAEQVGVYDITRCDPPFIDLKDNFPGTRFVPQGYSNHELPDFDWDGFDQFVFNTSMRNGGWGSMYIYNWKTHKPTLIFPGECCYRDARWSPDGTYLLYEFQDQKQGPDAKATLYYVPVGELNTGAIFTPIPLPEGFFKDVREAAQPALRPAK
jgi:serine/threonine-protein kinase